MLRYDCDIEYVISL